MYSEGGWIAILGVLLSLSFVGFGVWFVNYKINGKLKEKEWLTRYVAVILTALVGLFIVDKVVSWKTPLLSDEMSHGIWDLIKNIVLVIFGYQFGGSQTKNSDNE